MATPQLRRTAKDDIGGFLWRATLQTSRLCVIGNVYSFNGLPVLSS
jgi:hypothetical protein